jgi:hypothetical protein
LPSPKADCIEVFHGQGAIGRSQIGLAAARLLSCRRELFDTSTVCAVPSI